MIQELIQIGERTEHRGIVVTSVYPRQDPMASYVTLDDGLAQGLLVRETSKRGSVPKLVVENPLDERVLLYDAEELVGAKQNRILNISILVEAKATLTIPVSCVEVGRWQQGSPGFDESPHISHPELRRRKAKTQADQPHGYGIAQAVVWDVVREKSVFLCVHSDTGASNDLYRSFERDLRSLEDAFPAQPGQCGAVVGIGRDLCLDLVSRPDAFARLWPKLRAGYLLDALRRLDGQQPDGEIETLLAAVAQSEQSRQPSVGLGEDLRLRSDYVLGSGLELDGELIQLSAFRSENGDRRSTSQRHRNQMLRLIRNR